MHSLHCRSLWLMTFMSASVSFSLVSKSNNVANASWKAHCFSPQKHIANAKKKVFCQCNCKLHSFNDTKQTWNHFINNNYWYRFHLNDSTSNSGHWKANWSISTDRVPFLQAVPHNWAFGITRESEIFLENINLRSTESPFCCRESLCLCTVPTVPSLQGWRLLLPLCLLFTKSTFCVAIL